MEWFSDIVSWLWNNDEVRFCLDAILKLSLAALFSGFIGYEREHSHRPAGFRTHILVAVGSALVMLTSVYITQKYSGTMAIDPTRMSAQVISGIGFLGAGTILREGFSVKGLTTAASLWAVSCIGIAVGAGFIGGAVIATIVIYVTLNSLKKVIVRGHAGSVVYVEVNELEMGVPEISKIIKDTGTVVHSMEILYDNDSKFKKKKATSTIKALIFPRSEEALNLIVSELRATENIVDVYVV
ncbi:MAG: MgtC/SapB family protein [Oscillospiraceae bacterium]